jgi:DNA replication protein DnaC
MTVSKNKIDSEKEKIISGCANCQGSGCPKCFGYCTFIDRMAIAEIPVDYWLRELKDFYGNKEFFDEITKYINSLDEQYRNGSSLCLVGHPGTGKTMAACSILKKCLLPHKNIDHDYTAYYITVVDMVSKLMSQNGYEFRDSIKYYDFMVIDEVDQRFFPSEASKSLYGNHFESVLRTRVQNKLPTIICTNSEDVDQIFAGEFQKTFGSLRSQFFKVLRAGGKDARKGQEKHE